MKFEEFLSEGFTITPTQGRFGTRYHVHDHNGKEPMKVWFTGKTHKEAADWIESQKEKSKT